MLTSTPQAARSFAGCASQHVPKQLIDMDRVTTDGTSETYLLSG